MLIFAAILAIFVYGMIAAMLGTILPDLSDRFHLTPTQNGTIASCRRWVSWSPRLASGRCSITQGDKIGLILGLALHRRRALPAAPLAGIPLHRIAPVSCSASAAASWSPGANALANSVSEEHRAIALNLVNLFFGLGGLTTPFISANLFKQNWVRLCYTVASLTVVTLIDSGHGSKMPAPSGTRNSSSPTSAPSSAARCSSCSAFPLPLHHLRSRRVELASAPPHRPGHSRSRRLSISSPSDFALGLLIGRVGVSPILIRMCPPINVTLALPSPWPSPPSSCCRPTSLPWRLRSSSSPASPWRRCFQPRWPLPAQPFHK